MCDGSGRSAKNRQQPCPGCKGEGIEWVCKNCGGVYGKECVDTVMDQSYCGKKASPRV